jgi:hypothetical protein
MDHSLAPVAEPTTRRTTAALLLAVPVLFAAAYVVLSRAIGWPSSLDLPAEEALPLVAAEADGVRLGYLLYLACSLLFIPLAVLLPLALGLVGTGKWRPLVIIGIVVGSASGVLRALGISRWLTAMPDLADRYVEAAGGSAARDAIVVGYTTLNEYAGGLGELFGVGLFGGVWAILVGVAAMQSATGPGWSSALGVAAGSGLVVGVAVPAVSTVGWLFLFAWMVSLAVQLVRRRPA